MDDRAIVELYCRRDERAITETDRQYGAQCRALAQRLGRLRKGLRAFLESKGVDL